MLKPQDIASMIDHSLLKPELLIEDVLAGVETALTYTTASVCCRPSDLGFVARRLSGSGVKASTVIGFPHGSSLPKVKLYEAEMAMDEGCEELDVVLNIGRLKSGETAFVHDELQAICERAHARGAIVKVILENCYLSDEQKRLGCRLVEKAGGDFVKTSTGYGSGGATVHDLMLMKQEVGDRLRVKAAGGVRTLDAALTVRAIGCARFGATATKAILAEAEERFERGELREISDPARYAL